jgi:hypothetical protein
MAKCTACGVQFENEAKFCGNCGAPRTVETAAPPPPPPHSGIQSEPQPDYTASPQIPEPTGKKGRSIWFWIGGCAVIAVIACVVLVALAAYASSNLDVLELGPIKFYYSTETPVPGSSQIGSETVSEIEEPSLPQTQEISELGLDQELEAVAFRGTSFNYDPSLAGEIWSDTFPEVSEPLLDAAPEHFLFGFEDFNHPGPLNFPELIIFPTAQFGVLNPTAGEIILSLADFLVEKPAVVYDDIPFLPFINAAQATNVKIKYLNFQNGEGVRFLTQFGQDIWPINNQNILYTFQGLTNDGKYYVSAIFPISHPDLPADGYNYPGGDYETFEDNYERYIADIEALLNNAPDEAYTPQIHLLDNLIESLYVEME